MSSLDELPLSTSAYIADTQHLSLPQHGAYLLILMTMWRAGGWIDDDERKLATICKTSVAKWRKIAPDIRALLLSRDGKLSQKRLQKEIGKSLKIATVNRLNGSAGGKAKALKNKGTEVATATHSLPHSLQGRQTASDSALTTLTLTSFSRDSDSEVKKEKKVRAESRKGEVVPATWKPKEKHYQRGNELGGSREFVNLEGERMRNWSHANANRAVARKSDWDAAFFNWLDDKTERGKPRADLLSFTKRTGNESSSQDRTYPTPRPTSNGADAIMAGMGRVARRYAGGGHSTGPNDREIPDDVGAPSGSGPHR